MNMGAERKLRSWNVVADKVTMHCQMSYLTDEKGQRISEFLTISTMVYLTPRSTFNVLKIANMNPLKTIIRISFRCTVYFAYFLFVDLPSTGPCVIPEL